MNLVLPFFKEPFVAECTAEVRHGECTAEAFSYSNLKANLS